MPEALTQQAMIDRFRDRRTRHKELLAELAQRRRSEQSEVFKTLAELNRPALTKAFVELIAGLSIDTLTAFLDTVFDDPDFELEELIGAMAGGISEG